MCVCMRVCVYACALVRVCVCVDGWECREYHLNSKCHVKQPHFVCYIHNMLQCVAVCCSVLQCVAVCCSVLQCAAVCCSVLHCATV